MTSPNFPASRKHRTQQHSSRHDATARLLQWFLALFTATGADRRPAAHVSFAPAGWRGNGLGPSLSWFSLTSCIIIRLPDLCDCQRRHWQSKVLSSQKPPRQTLVFFPHRLGFLGTIFPSPPPFLVHTNQPRPTGTTLFPSNGAVSDNPRSKQGFSGEQKKVAGR